MRHELCLLLFYQLLHAVCLPGETPRAELGAGPPWSAAGSAGLDLRWPPFCSSALCFFMLQKGGFRFSLGWFLLLLLLEFFSNLKI